MKSSLIHCHNQYINISKVIRVEKRLWHSAQIVRLSMILMDLARFEVLAVAYEKISQ